MEFISQIVHIFKLGTKAYATAALFTGAVLYMKTLHPNILLSFNVNELVQNHMSFFFLIFIAATAALIVSIVSSVFALVIDFWNSRLIKKRQKEALEKLSTQEKIFLAGYIKNDYSTQRERYSSGIANGLEAKGIVFRSSMISSPGSRTFPYNIQPWAFAYLKKHPKLLT